MKTEDLIYICTTIGNLSGIPIRIYKNTKQIFYHSVVNLPKDPIAPYEKKILDVRDHIGYFITPRFHYYGIVNSGLCKIILGPSRQWTANKTDLNELAFECDVPQDETENFINAMESLVAMPLNSILQTLCSINFILNGEKLTIPDITIYDDEQLKLSDEINADETKKNYDEIISPTEVTTVHNTLALEQTIMNFVRHGDTAALKECFKNAPAVRSGILSSDTLRQLKNTFIVTATLVSRAAIRGGMDVNDALSLSDAYIQKCELLYSVESIENLQYHMVFDYTVRVEKLRLGKIFGSFRQHIRQLFAHTKKAARISLRFFWLCRATLFCFDWCFFTIMTFSGLIGRCLLLFRRNVALNAHLVVFYSVHYAYYFCHHSHKRVTAQLHVFGNYPKTR